MAIKEEREEIHALSMTMSLVLARPMVTREAERSKSTAWLLPGLKMRRAMVTDRWRIIEQQLIWQVVLPRVGGRGGGWMRFSWRW